MDYKKEYEAMVQRARELHEAGNFLTKKQMEIVCPELAESEDERIRKELIGQVEKSGHHPSDKARWLAWLEKQKEQKPAEYIKRNSKEWYSLLTEQYDKGFWKGKAEQKPVEYLDKDKVYAIMTKLTNLSQSQLIPTNSDEFKKLHEITSEVRDLLDYPIEQKPAWSETKELVFKDICNHLEVEGYSGWVLLLNALRNGEFQPKVEWSDEDEKMIKSLILGIDKYVFFAGIKSKKIITWLKSLRPQKQEQKSKLEEYDETPIQWLKRLVRSYPSPITTMYETECRSDLISWLDNISVRLAQPQKYAKSHWKPSEEQMEALKAAIGYGSISSISDTTKLVVLHELYEQLKKL